MPVYHDTIKEAVQKTKIGTETLRRLLCDAEQRGDRITAPSPIGTRYIKPTLEERYLYKNINKVTRAALMVEYFDGFQGDGIPLVVMKMMGRQLVDDLLAFRTETLRLGVEKPALEEASDTAPEEAADTEEVSNHPGLFSFEVMEPGSHEYVAATFSFHRSNGGHRNGDTHRVYLPLDNLFRLLRLRCADGRIFVED